LPPLSPRPPPPQPGRKPCMATDPAGKTYAMRGGS